MTVRSLKVTSNRLKMGLKWGDTASERTRTVEKRALRHKRWLQALSISAAC